MSKGRAEFGTGRSSNPYQLDPFGVRLDETREEWEEVVEVVPKMWAPGKFSHKGRFWDIPERNILPKPIQKPHPPMWVAAQQPSTFELAGRKGIGALCFAVGAPEELKSRIGSYKKAIETAPEQVGLFKNNHLGAFSVAYCEESDKAARELAGPQAVWYLETIKKIYTPVWEGRNLSEIPESYKWHAKTHTLSEGSLERFGYDHNSLIDNGSLCVGNPDAFIKTIEKYEAAGADQVILFMQCGRMPHEKIMKSIKLIGRYVIPHFKEKERKKLAAKAGS
jgi:alkanesulfonate monooxygenase SsuD/methylene tetrahydromethanopterin reductase-like flavin-dependent oxidoreductase (luciferase family)